MRNYSMQDDPSVAEVWWCRVGRCSPYCPPMRASTKLSGTPIPAFWEPHFRPQPRVTSLSSRDAVGCRCPDPPQPCPAYPKGELNGSWHPGAVMKQGQARKMLMRHCFLLALVFCYIINALYCINLHKLSLNGHPTCLKPET